MKKKIHTFGYAYLKMMYNKLVFRINKMFIDDTFSTLSKSKQIKLQTYNNIFLEQIIK